MSYKDIIQRQLPNGLYRDNGINEKELKVFGDALDDIQNEIDKLEIEIIVTTAQSEGLDKYEEFLAIPTDIEKPIEQRRSVMISRLRGNSTVTKELIKAVAESYDKGEVEVIENYSGYTFVVRFIDTSGIPPNINDLKNAINEIKPAHLAVQYRYKYLVISEMEQLTINELEAMTLNDFENYQ